MVNSKSKVERKDRENESVKIDVDLSKSDQRLQKLIQQKNIRDQKAEVYYDSKITLMR